MNDQQRGFEATQILENTFFQERMQHLQDEALRHVLDSNLVDIEELRARVSYLQAANRFKQDFQRIQAIGSIPEEEQPEAPKAHWAARLIRRNT